MEPIRHTVHGSEAGITLQDFLAAKFGVSGRRAKALLDARSVLVNRRRVWMARHVLRARDVVEVLEAPSTPSARREPATLATPLWQDDDYIIVDKPAGIAAVGPRSMEELWQRGTGTPELCAVHRLDRDTTGCLILARSRAALEAMLPLFRDRRITKVYHTIVAGRVDPDLSLITRPIQGQTAVTHVRLLDARRGASHLTLKIDTGRTHQIRRHLAFLRHPVLGDRHYAPPADPSTDRAPVPRQMLHASAIDFPHPRTGESVRATAPLPADFRRCLREYGLT